MKYCYEYPRPAVCVDIIIYCKSTNKILLIERKNDPYRNFWALPGGFVDENEDLTVAAYRELYEETAVENMDLKQYRTYGTPGRDPRGHIISVVFVGTCEKLPKFKAGDDAKNAGWFKLNELPQLAFDHKIIIVDYFSPLD